MKWNKVRRWSVMPLALALMFAAAGCDSSGSSSSEPSVDLNGNWRFTITLLGNNCGAPPGLSESFDAVIVQSGKKVTISDVDGEVELNGTLEGSQLTFKGTYARSEDGCDGRVDYDGGGPAEEDRLSGQVTADIETRGAGCDVQVDCRAQGNYLGRRS